MKLTLAVVVYNGGKYLPYFLDSLKNQEYKDFNLIIFDNASKDSSLEIIEEYKNSPLLMKEGVGGGLEIIKSKENIGYVKAYNKIFDSINTEYFGVLNQDLLLEPDCILKLVNFLEENKEVSAVAPRTMKWDFESNKKTNIIDSLGLKIFKSRRVIELESGKDWEEIKTNYNKNVIKVFGLSAAFAIYKTDILKQALLNGRELFDESYEMYKEDVDLAYRLMQKNAPAYTVLNAVCYHDRTAYASGDLSDMSAVKNKKNQPSFIKKLSYRNHLYTLCKNEYWQNFVLDLPFILWYEMKKLIWFLIYDRSVLLGLIDLFKNRKKLKDSRVEIKNKRKVGWREIRKLL